MKSVFALGLIAILPSLATAKGPPPAARTADAILNDYARAIGGEEAWSKIKNLHVKSAVSVQNMGISGVEERHATSANQFRSVTNIPGIATFRQGSDGHIRWAEDPINGLRILTGGEDEQTLLDTTWNADLKLQHLYKQVRWVPVPGDAPGREKLECLQLVAHHAPVSIVCFDATTHLRAWQKGTRATPQGETPYSVTFKEWRTIGALKVPAIEEMTTGPMTMEAHLESIVFDEKLDPALFALPPAVAKAKR